MSLSRRTLLALGATTATLVLSGGPAWAGPATDVVREKQALLFRLLEADPPDEAKIAAVFDEMLDYRGLAEASLGSEWAKLTDAQRAEITDLLKQLVTRAYEKHLKKTLAYRIEYVGEEELPEGHWRVDTRAIHKTDPRAETVHVGFELRPVDDGRFKVVDLVIEEVSLVGSYRAQFAKILKKEGWDGLIKRLKDKIAKGGGD